VYLAVNVTEPAASEPAGIVIVAEPELSEVADDA
jgi:RNA polymerase subunit RPABC4/transcription elongation factor Spt4